MDIQINYLFMKTVYNATSIMENQQDKFKNMFKYKIKLKNKLIYNYQMIIILFKMKINI